MNGRQPAFGQGFFLGGLSGPPPRDLGVLLAVLFVTYSLQFFATTAPMIGLLRLSSAVWRYGAVWQLATFPFVGWSGGGPPSPWILLELLFLYLFGRDVFERLGRRRFWTLIAYATVGGGLVAVVVDLVSTVAGGGSWLLEPFVLIQGQHYLFAVAVAAFATLNRHATILLFFVLPMPARWFIWLEIVIAFIGYLGTRDLAGFLGICVGVAITVGVLRPGGPRRALRESWLRMQQWWMRKRLARLRKKRGIRVVPGEGGRGGGGRDPWLH